MSQYTIISQTGHGITDLSITQPAGATGPNTQITILNAIVQEVGAPPPVNTGVVYIDLIGVAIELPFWPAIWKGVEPVSDAASIGFTVTGSLQTVAANQYLIYAESLDGVGYSSRGAAAANQDRPKTASAPVDEA